MVWRKAPMGFFTLQFCTGYIFVCEGAGIGGLAASTVAPAPWWQWEWCRRVCAAPVQNFPNESVKLCLKVCKYLGSKSIETPARNCYEDHSENIIPNQRASHFLPERTWLCLGPFRERSLEVLAKGTKEDQPKEETIGKIKIRRVLKNLLMPFFLMGCFPGDFQEGKRPIEAFGETAH